MSNIVEYKAKSGKIGKYRQVEKKGDYVKLESLDGLFSFWTKKSDHDSVKPKWTCYCGKSWNACKRNPDNKGCISIESCTAL